MSANVGGSVLVLLSARAVLNERMQARRKTLPPTPHVVVERPAYPESGRYAIITCGDEHSTPRALGSRAVTLDEMPAVKVARVVAKIAGVLSVLCLAWTSMGCALETTASTSSAESFDVKDDDPACKLPWEAGTPACDFCRPFDEPDAALVLRPVWTTLPTDPHTGLTCEVEFPDGSLGWCCPSK